MLGALRKYLSGYVVLTDEEFNVLSEVIEIRNFDKRKQLVGIGEKEEYLNFIVKGLARKYFLKGKEEIVTQIARENDLISASVSFLKAEPSTCIIETIEATVFLSIKKDNLEKLYRYSHKLEHLGRLIVTSLFLQKEEWDNERMRLNTRDRFVHFVSNNSDLLQRVPQKYLASYLNIKPETFSRLKHLLLKKK